MSDRMIVEIELGGPVPARLVKRLIVAEIRPCALATEDILIIG